ncbi:pyridoxamine 5'-phosphate oxidase family protein [Corynebacterium suedekumii]|nr:pyridoxamine 5'-phosphate oxidase family protein [Corynebacterium suedekumii]
MDELWNDATAAWYEGGKNDANLGVVRVTSQAAQLWNQEGGMVSQFLDFAKARISGEKPDGGTGTINL